MANFAEIDDNNIVLWVIVIPDDQEHRGEEYITQDLKISSNRWIQTSVNTRQGKHRLGGIPLRKNYAGVGYTYDEQRDAFIPPKPADRPSWIINEETCTWIPPVPRPTDGKKYIWDEATVSWKEKT